MARRASAARLSGSGGGEDSGGGGGGGGGGVAEGRRIAQPIKGGPLSQAYEARKAPTRRDAIGSSSPKGPNPGPSAPPVCKPRHASATGLLVSGPLPQNRPSAAPRRGDLLSGMNGRRSALVAQHQAGAPRTHDFCAEPVRAFARLSPDPHLIERPCAPITKDTCQNAGIVPGKYVAETLEEA